jgi:hypothetical protein
MKETSLNTQGAVQKVKFRLFGQPKVGEHTRKEPEF